MAKRNLQYLDPADLTIHPDLKHDHRMAKDSAAWVALVEDIRENGIRDAIHIDSANRVVDGRHRFWAAKQLKLAEVPCLLVPDNSVATTILSAILNRRHYTKGQRAFVIVRHMDAAFQEGLQRKVGNLKGVDAPLSVASGRTSERLSEQWGLSKTLIEQARTLHKKFTDTPELREEWEPKIMDEDAPVGLGHAIAGIGGETSTKDKPKRNAEQLELFAEAFEVLGKRCNYYAKLDEAARAAVQPKLRSTVAAMPPELRKALKKAISQVEREERQHA